MNIFEKSLLVVGMFDGKILRVARVSSGEEKTISQEQSYSVSDFPEGDLWSRVRADFGNILHLVISEEGVYTFSIDIPKEESGSRKSIEGAIRDFFPEDSVGTAWDYRVIERKDDAVSLEVTELKRELFDVLMQGRKSGIIFGSIIPESLALARVVGKKTPTLVAHRKDADSFLFVCCEGNIVYASFFLKKPFLAADVSMFLEYCEKKKGKKVTSVYGSGFSQEELRECPVVTEIAHAPLDPLLGASDRSLWKKDERALDLSLSVQGMSRAERNIRYCFRERVSRWNNTL